MKTGIRKAILGFAAAGALILGGCAGGPEARSTGEFIDDTTIHTKVKAALVNDPVITGRGIDVDVMKGVVSLRGAVNSEAEKKKAEDTVRGVAGVKGLDSQLVVRGQEPLNSGNTATNTPPAAGNP
jgi:osmotically-inducible protein OsmY